MNEVWTAAWPILQTIIIGLALWRIQHVAARTEAKRAKLEECRDEYQLLTLNTINASVKLGEATAIAIKNKQANGEVKDALEYVQITKDEQRQFVEKQGIKSLRI